MSTRHCPIRKQPAHYPECLPVVGAALLPTLAVFRIGSLPTDPRHHGPDIVLTIRKSWSVALSEPQPVHHWCGLRHSEPRLAIAWQHDRHHRVPPLYSSELSGGKLLDAGAGGAAAWQSVPCQYATSARRMSL